MARFALRPDVYRVWSNHSTGEGIVRSHSVSSGGCAVASARFRRSAPCVPNSKGGRSIGSTHSNIINPIVPSNPTVEIARWICDLQG
jgi:hypothetical protein